MAIIMLNGMAGVTTAVAQIVQPLECPDDVAVEGVIWDISTDNEGRAYATGNGGVYKSCDGGNSWTKPVANYAPGLSVHVSPTRSGEVYFGSNSKIYKSTDFAQTFVAVGSNIAERIWSIASDSNGNLYAGADNSIYRSDDAGNTWQLLANSPTGHAIQAITVDYSNDNILFAGTNGGGFFRSVDGGVTWDQQSNGTLNWQVKEIVQDPLNPAIVFAASWDGLWRSVDAGTNWIHVTGNRVIDIALDPAVATSIFAVSWDSGVMQSIDGGNTWMPAKQIPGVPANKIYSLAILQTGRILVGTEFLGLYASDDGGNTWMASGESPVNDPEPAGGNGGSESDGFVQLHSTLEYLGNGGIPAGQDGRFQITIRNTGTAISDDRFVRIVWFRSPQFGENELFDFTATTTQGSCQRSITPEPDCHIGPIPAGASVVITINAKTRPGKLGWYTLRFAMIDSQGFNNGSDEFSVGTIITVAESGGGASGLLSLFLMMLGILHRRIAGGLSKHRFPFSSSA